MEALTLHRVRRVAPQLAVALAAVILQLAFYVQAGGLWRDEVNTVQLGRMPLRESWLNLQFDNFPGLTNALLHGWTALGAGDSDRGLRTFGLMIGVSLLAAVGWTTAQLGTGPVALIALLLVGLNPVAVRTYAALRPYGTGVLLSVVLVGAAWRVVQTGRMRWWAASSLIASLSVHALYQNAFLVLAICSAAAVAAAMERRWRRAAAVLLSGAVAALALIPCVGILQRGADWRQIMEGPLDTGLVWTNLMESLGDRWGTFCWVLTLALLTLYVGTRWPRSTTAARAQLAYLVLTFLGSASAFALVIVIAKLPTQPWYFVPPLTVCAVCVSAGLGDLMRSRPALTLSLCAAVVSFMIALPAVSLKQTSVDVAAQYLNTNAAKGDLILVAPWYYGVSFRHYYHGSAPVSTLPPAMYTEIHRYDRLRSSMAESDPLSKTREDLKRVLDGNGIVWLVGGVPPLPPGATPRRLPPAPQSEYGWSSAPYEMAWAYEISYLLNQNVRHAKRIVLTENAKVSRWEDAPLHALFKYFDAGTRLTPIGSLPAPNSAD